MLAKRPEQRFGSMSEVVQALDKSSRTRRRAWWWAVAALIGVVVVGVAVWVRNTSQADVPPPIPSEPVIPAPGKSQPPTPAPDDAADEVYRAAAHTGHVRTLTFDRASTGLFSGGDDGRVVWHDLKERKVHRTMSMPPAVTAVAVAGSRLMIGTANGQVRIWSLDGPQPKEVHGFVRHKGAVTVFAASPDGTFAVSGDGEEAHVWNLVGQPKTGPLPQTAGPVLAAHFRADRPEFATVVGRVGLLPAEVWQWKLSTTKEGLKEYHPQGVARPKESAGATAFAVSDRVMFAVVGDKVFGWEFGSGQAVGIYQGHPRAVRHLSVAGSADVVVTADDAEVHVWDAKNLTRRWKGRRLGVTAVGVSDDGLRIAVGTEAGEVLVFQTSK